ncbi:hormogonium polysaccharide biosynthesis protein HpsA [Microcoleus sp. POL10_C6]|uniref:hormogonium polysaccharide biosynthesis protein HpsA n=1 Tax=Microcoleus sp. POL10_C6 TaxID=2818852 RepID=UPI002FD71547
MFKSKLSKVIVSLLRRIAGVTRSGAKRLMRAMLQTLMAMGRRARLPVAGFVLPTVTMVLLVVILLTVAITLRSFDRANTARNVRVNQQVLAAATPALDRAKAKIQFMLQEDPQRPTATPSDNEMYRIMSSASGQDLYTFGGENRLTLKYDLDGNGTVAPFDPAKLNALTDEQINTAWRYPVDTDKDGVDDTYTIYGIFFRSPPRNPSGDFTRARKPLEARTPPMSGGSLKKGCEAAAGTSASLVGDSGWYKIDGRLKKSFFVYTVNVPMAGKFKGTPSVSALEYQQDQSRIPLSNNAVVYEDDLEISPGPSLKLNGRMMTNSNLIVTTTRSGEQLNLYQVSSKDSCFYEQENSKIIVGGNVVNGHSGNNSSQTPVPVHLFKKGDNSDYPKTNLTIDTTNQSTKNSSLGVIYNNQAFTDRIAALVRERIGPVGSETDPLTDPISVQNAQLDVAGSPGQTREQALEEYFKQRTRKVPFAEVPFGVNGTGGAISGNLVDAGGPGLRPKLAWADPQSISQLSLTAEQLEAKNPEPPPEEETYIGDRVVAGNNLPALLWDNTKNQFVSASQPLGNWTDDGTARTRSSQVTQLADVGATDRDGFWEKTSAQIPATPLDGIGGLRIITSAGVYDRTTSFLPPPSWINSAGNRVSGPAKIGDALTSSNTYDDPETTGAGAVEQYPVVWPDSMPMSPLGPGSKVYDNVAGTWTRWRTATMPASGGPEVVADANGTDLPVVTDSAIDPSTPKFAKGDLRMRASAVYHYADSGYNQGDTPQQTPFACVSSYYDPSTALTARNISTLADVSGDLTLPATTRPANTKIGSHNGIVYEFPGRPTDLGGPLPITNGLLTGGNPIYTAQANYVFPDGRFANKPLREALLKAEGDRNLEDLAAIDSTACAVDILQSPTASTAIPAGAIQEVAFLNAREIKAVDADNTTTAVNEEFTLSSPLPVATPPTAPAAILTGNYNQPIEERQPLEVRATQLNIEELRGEEFTGTNGPAPAKEYLLPNSGVIYASRDDALPDRSARSADENRDKLVSPTDSLLDPTRKPNGILVINGQKLFRGKPGPVRPNPYTVADVVREKGLTLVSNLPVYIKGEFNKHSQQEFATALTDNWSNFYGSRGILNPNFACRAGDPRLKDCTIGDNWRPATVLADAVTLLSGDYRFGFRNEGDFDLRNNAGAAAVLPRRQQGFYHNNFVTNGLTSRAFLSDGKLSPDVTPATALQDSDYATPQLNSSYFNNFITPVQRRGNFPEYLMETCIKLPVSECTEADWFVDPLTPVSATQTGRKVSDVITSTPTYNQANRLSTYKAGTTADPPIPALQRFPRRVAFPRTAGNLAGGATPRPYAISGTTVSSTASGTPKANSLWFATTATPTATAVNYGQDPLPFVVNRNGTDWNGINLPVLSTTATFQPLLMPVLQLQTVGTAAASAGPPVVNKVVKETGWLPRAKATSFHLIVGAGDIPSRALNANTGDSNGGLQNLPRFLESWQIGGVDTPTDIKGSFVQLNRSAYSTSPYLPILPPDAPSMVAAATKLKSLFERPTTSPIAAYTAPDTAYRTDGGGRFPYFIPPKRDWGFDVGLLSQPPDLFTQRFTTPPRKTQPDEYFREVGRDDKWVQTLMCAELASTPGTYAVDAPFKPSVCPPPA